MATLSTAGRNAAATAILALIDAGTAANMIVTTAGAVQLALFTFSDPSFTGPATGVLTADLTPALDAVVSANGEAALWSIRDSANTVVLSGTVSDTGSPDIAIDDATLVIADVLTISLLTITVPAS